MRPRQFTVDQAERMIPALERIFVDVLQLQAALRALERKLERAGLAPDAAAEDEDEGSDERPEVVHVRRLHRAYGETLLETVQRIRALGCEIKDLDEGVVDFPGRRAGEDVLLCWKIGEKRIEHWHPMDEGYSARQPLDDQVAREPGRAE